MGEYTVLDGSLAFAVPTKYGQYLEFEPENTGTITWHSYDADGSLWLKTALSVDAVIKNELPENSPEAVMLFKVLHAAHSQNPNVLTSGFEVITKLTFPRNWGLGTSSTFIALVAEWFGIDAYKLLEDTFGGSGYDIACAQHNTPLLYKKVNGVPEVTPVTFNPDFTDKLWFVYLNQKQNSREGIAAYRQRVYDKEDLVSRINKLIEELSTAQDFSSFTSALEKQEALIASILGILTVQEKLFPDFKGVIKSLGAWGGDFVLAAAEENPTEYFKAKGYETIVAYKDMVL